MAGPNFELITELQTVTRRDFPVAVQDLLNPNSSSVPLIDGEWLDLTQNAAGGQQLERGSGQNILCFPLHTERGRYDTQAIGKATILMLGMFEADTKVYATGDGLAVGAKLVVATSSTRRVVQGKTSPALTDVVVGYVTKVAAGGKIRFVHFGNTFGVGV